MNSTDTPAGTRVCRNCGSELPLADYEQYPNGHRRGICRRCHYLLHTKAARYRWLERRRAEAFYGRLTMPR